MLTVIGAVSAVSPTTSRRTSLAAPTHASTRAGTALAPDTCTRTPFGVGAFDTFAVHPLRISVPVVTPLLKSPEKTPA